MTDKRMQERGDQYAASIRFLVESALEEGFWFEASRGPDDVMDGIDINWKGVDGRCYREIWGDI